MPKEVSIPVTTCECLDTPNRRVFDLTSEGLPEIPVLGLNHSVQTGEGSIFHRHDSLEITCCVQGSVKFDCDGRAYPVLPGDVFVSRPEDVHRLRVNPKGAKLFWLFLKVPRRGRNLLGLDVESSEWILNAVQSLPHRSFPVPDAVGACFERLFTILDGERPKTAARRLKLRATAIQLLIALVEAAQSTAQIRGDQRLRALVDRMRREPKKTFSIEEIAAELRCSPNTVRARFRKYTGFAPKSFIMKCRIHRALDLLRAGKMSVTEVALELGFSSSQNFAIRFRQETGRSPSQWLAERRLA